MVISSRLTFLSMLITLFFSSVAIAQEDSSAPLLGPLNSDPLAGFNKDIGRNWTLSGFRGMNGTRKQGTLMFGYRW